MIRGAQAHLLPGVPGRQARSIIHFALANVPGRGRSPWELVLRDALLECAREAGHGSMLLDAQWYLSGTLVAEVALETDPEVVGDVVQSAIVLAAKRHAAQQAESIERERLRQQLEAELRALIASARKDQIPLFGEVNVVNDEWLGTFGWLAFLQIRAGGPGGEELTQTQAIFGNAPAAFPNLHVRDGRLAFSISAMTSELESALQTAIENSQRQASHVRDFKARQAKTFQAMAASIEQRFGRLPN